MQEQLITDMINTTIIGKIGKCEAMRVWTRSVACGIQRNQWVQNLFPLGL